MSYLWITPEHPDSKGFHLAIIAEVVEIFMTLEKTSGNILGLASCYKITSKTRRTLPRRTKDSLEPKEVKSRMIFPSCLRWHKRLVYVEQNVQADTIRTSPRYR